MAENQATQSKKRYPWLQALLVLALYGGLLALLWYFPIASVRPFFQTLLRGFGYFMAGLVLFLITLLFVILFPFSGVSETAPKSAGRNEADDADDDDADDDDADDDAADDDDSGEWQSLFTGRSLMIPELMTPEQSKVWDVLYAFESELDPECIISVDAGSGIVTVIEDDENDVTDLIQELQLRLSQAGITPRPPR